MHDDDTTTPPTAWERLLKAAQQLSPSEIADDDIGDLPLWLAAAIVGYCADLDCPQCNAPAMPGDLCADCGGQTREAP